MALSFLTDQSPGAPQLQGVNGSLVAVLDWALVQQGWAIEYTNGANARVYRPAVGNRHRLHVNHDSAVSGQIYLATIRGCEGATSATDLIDPFPQVSQVANAQSTFCIANNATGTRAYKIVVTPTFLIMGVGTTSPSDTAGWDMLLFGDVEGGLSGDTYGTIVHVGNNGSTSSTSRGLASCLSSAVSANSKTYWCRSADGSLKSTYGVLSASVATTSALGFCTVTGAPAMRGGYLNQIMREKVAATCIGSTSAAPGPLAVMRRGWVPNLWNPLHTSIGGITTGDVFTDSAYAVGSQFSIMPASTTIAAIIEHTDSWSPPVG